LVGFRELADVGHDTIGLMKPLYFAFGVSEAKVGNNLFEQCASSAAGIARRESQRTSSTKSMRLKKKKKNRVVNQRMIAQVDPPPE
jgi:hypothetical protein